MFSVCGEGVRRLQTARFFAKIVHTKRHASTGREAYAGGIPSRTVPSENDRKEEKS